MLHSVPRAADFRKGWGARSNSGPSHGTCDGGSARCPPRRARCSPKKMQREAFFCEGITLTCFPPPLSPTFSLSSFLSLFLSLSSFLSSFFCEGIALTCVSLLLSLLLFFVRGLPRRVFSYSFLFSFFCEGIALTSGDSLSATRGRLDVR